jgi:predicted metal-dependent hydrolase
LTDAVFRAAIELFNGARYLAAHELFDELWEADAGSDADFYKGLVQASIALHHFEEGNLEGAAKLYRAHRRSLAGFLPNHGGVDVDTFLQDMQVCLGAVIRREANASFADAARPRIELGEKSRNPDN